MKFKIFGIGAAGNKCAINIVEKGFADIKDIVLINSTIRDIPLNYRDHVIRLSDDVQGCGQERKLAQDICLKAIKDQRLNLDSIVDPEYDKVVIITSTCGGTGSGASVIIAKYLREVIDIAVEVIGLVGFSDESARSLKNLIEFCQDLNDQYAIQLIRNDAYLDAVRGNRTAAEQAANDEVAQRIRVMSGSMLRDSEQNIDDTDIRKLNNTAGYKTVEYIELYDRIKNQQQFNEILREMMDDSPIIDVDPENEGIGRLGVMINASGSSLAYVDRSYSILRERLGEPYEVFTHIESISDYPQFIAIIASGMKMPYKAIETVFDKYKEMNSAVNKDQDSFFEKIKDFDDEESDMFDSYKSEYQKRKIEAARAQFFNQFDHEVVPRNDDQYNKRAAKNDKGNKSNNEQF